MNAEDKPSILVVYHSRHGATRLLARQVARGASRCDVNVLSREVHDGDNGSAPEPTLEELRDCDGLILGCPTRFGNISAPLKAFIDETSALWMSGALVGKPGAAFTSTASLHGGQEMTLMGMLVPMMHHGMVLTGLPYTESDLMTTDAGGTPYGASHWSRNGQAPGLSTSEKNLARALGERVARLAITLRDSR